MLRSLKYNLGNLTNFTGREDRALFWPYAGLVFGLGLFAILLAMIPVVNHSLTQVQQYAAAHPDQVTETVGPGSYSISIRGDHPGLVIDLAPFSYAMAALALAILMLLAAAATRRLHDTNRRGWWGLLPFPFLIFSMIEMPAMFRDFGRADSDMGLFLAVFLSNLLYNIMLVLVIVLLAWRGTRGANRFGEQPG